MTGRGKARIGAFAQRAETGKKRRVLAVSFVSLRAAAWIR
jgi:hypothetical protein